VKPRKRRLPTAPSEAVCPDGLLCALALDPCSVPRNRHFLLYTAPPARAAHRRAGALRRLRRLVAEMLHSGRPHIEIQEQDGGLRLDYHDESLALQRAIALGPLEASLLRCMLGDGASGPLSPRADDRERVRAALRTVDSRFGIDPERLVA
jgi:hypothetical protein